MCLTATLLALASPASAATPCEPRAASRYRYDQSQIRAVFLLRLCQDVDQVPVEIEFERLNLLTSEGLSVFVLGIAPCRNRVCVTSYGYEHGNEFARYRFAAYWAVATDTIGPLVCVTTPDRSGCRSPA
jgi:hypothetical protein